MIKSIYRFPESKGNNVVQCKFCGADILEVTAHFHQGEWIGDECCWDDSLAEREETQFVVNEG